MWLGLLNKLLGCTVNSLSDNRFRSFLIQTPLELMAGPGGGVLGVRSNLILIALHTQINLIVLHCV